MLNLIILADIVTLPLMYGLKLSLNKCDWNVKYLIEMRWTVESGFKLRTFILIPC